MDLRFPPALEPGQTVAICAPSSPFERDELWRGLAWLRQRYRLRIAAHVFARHGYLAGEDDVRRADLSAMMVDPEVRAIVFARGGYGAMRIAFDLPWGAFAVRPKWLVGFSDITALHVLASGRGVASVHAPNVTGLGRSISPAERWSFLQSLERPRAARCWEGLQVVHAGPPVRGPVIGGNLALFEAMVGAPGTDIPHGAIIVLEDVTERPYRVDRMLTSLVRRGAFARASALVFGGFHQCGPGPDGVTIDPVIAETTASLGIPVMRGAPFGHGSPNHAFVLGCAATLHGTTLRFG